jgi:hypothetical protein
MQFHFSSLRNPNIIVTCAEIWQQNLANDVQGALLPFQPQSLLKT